MNLTKAEENLHKLLESFDKESFIYDLLLAYGKPKASITRLKSGTYNLSKQPGEVLWKKVVFFKVLEGGDLHHAIDDYRNDASILKHAPRFLILTDFKTLLAVDAKTHDTLDIPILKIHQHFDFFLPWAGMEKAQHVSENLADVKAAERMAKLYDEITKENTIQTMAELHALNVFLCRILFCFFAEDTEIFPKRHSFTQGITSHTQEDGSDLGEYLDRLFEVLNTPHADKNLRYLGTMLEPLTHEPRAKYPQYLQEFPYVNGGLFRDKLGSPQFSRKARKLLIESGELDWSAINPDIFGSMMQAVVHTSQRGSLGMHYTSVPNIMKVIEPLFLNELREELAKAQGDVKKLEKLHQRIQNIKVFDPACGSGNFLIISYKELRRLEMEIFTAMQAASGQQKMAVPFSKIKLTQFYGIELDDFAHEVAILGLWLAEHQMNVKFKAVFGKTNPALPLGQGGKVVRDNATRRDWNNVCPNDAKTEIYVLGNPPYLGSSNQDEIQKTDMGLVFQGIQNYKNLDYIACWFFKGAQYIHETKAQLAFVSTNSICQGEQVALLWPHIFNKDIEINFAYTSFKWANNAKYNAGVTCIIVSLRNPSKKPKYLYSANQMQQVENINGYLTNGDNIIVSKRIKPISELPSVSSGNKPVDGGHLILSSDEKDALIQKHPSAQAFIKKLLGSSEFIKGQARYCLWISDEVLNEAISIPLIAQRIEQCKLARLGSKDVGAQKLATRPHQFRDFFETQIFSIIIPEVSSERREYVPTGFIDSNTVITNKLFAIYAPEPWVFAVISSKMHNVWVRAVAGRLEERISYSSVLCYNTFPFPSISERQKETLTTHVWHVIAEREKHPEKTLAQLYDPDKMPDGLREAHQHLDRAIEQCYRSKPFATDEERLAYLFQRYEAMTQAPQQLELQNAL